MASTYARIARTYQSVASIVLYSGATLPSGKRLGSMPWLTNWAKARRIGAASSGRPAASASPGRLIIVSRPQSSNQW